ncbi:hypothetical protein PINS_up000494 [Pythium insidiosum]|nr:hypothetical protein PINS_up000494 [Pythium insidiosum]
MFTRSLDLVFSEKLVAFHAITGVRNALMECKQSIEDQLVLELHHIIYLKSTFASLAKANQYSMAAIEHELNSASLLDNEFEKLVFQSNQNEEDKGKSLFADTTASLTSTRAFNHLEAAVNAVKKVRREMEVIGALRSSLENELNEVVIEISLICRGIFNSSSHTSFDNNFTERKFGSHDHSANFQTFLRLLFHVLRRIAQRHFLTASYFNANGDSWNYGMSDVIAKITSVLERVLGEYLEDASTTETLAGAAAKDIKSAVSTGDLFRLSRNKQPDDRTSSRLLLPHDYNGKVIEETHTRVCDPSVFHLPIVYDDLEAMARDLQEYVRVATTHLHLSTSSSSTSLPFAAFLHQFVTTKWIPKVKAKAQVF